jgi:hypothetical protein
LKKKDVMLVTFFSLFLVSPPPFPGMKGGIVLGGLWHWGTFLFPGVVRRKRTNERRNEEEEEEELVPGAGRCVELIHQGSGRFVRLGNLNQLYVSRRFILRWTSFEACHELALNNPPPTDDGNSIDSFFFSSQSVSVCAALLCWNWSRWRNNCPPPLLVVPFFFCEIENIQITSTSFWFIPKRTLPGQFCLSISIGNFNIRYAQSLDIHGRENTSRKGRK